MIQKPEEGHRPLLLRQQTPFDWHMPPGRAANAQSNLSERVILCPLVSPQLVAGVDIAYSVNGEVGYAAIVVMRMPKLKIVEVKTAQGVIDYPYSPGFLAFREGALSASVIRKLGCQPDVILFDGSGVAHPRRFGLASHIGVLFDIPAVGCAKTPLVVTCAEPGPNRGDFAPLLLDAQVVGAALRTRVGVKPVFVSPGHRADLPSALELVLATTTHYRFPEPIRRAHRHANLLRADSSPRV